MPRCFAAYRLHSESVTGTPKETNFAFLVLKRAVDTYGFTGPDGRTANENLVTQRMADTWLNYARVHLERGSKRLAVRGMTQHILHAPHRARAIFRCGTLVARVFLRRGSKHA
jgi:hypothetical protein